MLGGVAFVGADLATRFQDSGEGAPSAGSARYARVLRNALRIGRNVVVLHASRVHEHRLEDTPPQERRIDVWWWEDGSSRLALLFAYLMTRSATWDEATIRLLAPAAEGHDQKLAKHLAGMLDELRIDAEIVAVVGADADAIAKRSRDASTVFLPLRLAGLHLVDPFGSDCDALVGRLPLMALVGAGEAVKLGEEPEEAPAAAADAESPAATG